MEEQGREKRERRGVPGKKEGRGGVEGTVRGVGEGEEREERSARKGGE